MGCLLKGRIRGTQVKFLTVSALHFGYIGQPLLADVICGEVTAQDVRRHYLWSALYIAVPFLSAYIHACDSR